MIVTSVQERPQQKDARQKEKGTHEVPENAAGYQKGKEGWVETSQFTAHDSKGCLYNEFQHEN